MTPPANCMLRATVARFPSHSRSTFSPRAFVETSEELASITARLSSSSTSRRQIIYNRHTHAPGFVSLSLSRSEFSLMIQSRLDARRKFSTAAVANEYSPDDEAIHDYDLSPTKIDEHGGGERMPRLNALRERLRLGNDTLRDHQSSSVQHSFERNVMTNRPPSEMETMDDITAHLVASDERNILTDTHGRHHNYLRISLSERCNLRCQYCMPPEGVPLSPSSKLLTDEEIVRLVRVFVKNGVDKVRLTGGEPLLRPNLASLVRSISDALRTFDENYDANVNEGGLVGMTTNGISLSRQIDDLVDAGLTGVNISLDTLSADRFLEITRRNGLDKVMRAIGDCTAAFRRRYGHARVGPNGSGGSRVKINCVVMRGINDDELSDFVRMADERFGGDVDIRFIEWMPFNDNGWNASRFVSYKDMLDKMSLEGTPLERIGDGPNDTTKWWRVQKNALVGRGISSGRSATRIGFITSMSEHFCSSCNRLRITADGKIKVCLFGSNEKEVSLRDIMRKHQHDDSNLQQDVALEKVIYAAVQKKTFALGGHGSAENIAKAADNRPMTLIGG